jgi:hypothetical protein
MFVGVNVFSDHESVFYHSTVNWKKLSIIFFGKGVLRMRILKSLDCI